MTLTTNVHLAVVLAAFASSSALAADRLTDRDVRELVERIDHELITLS